MQTTYLVNKEASQYCSVKHFLPLSGRSIRTKDLGFEYINCRPNASPLLLTEQYWEASKQPHLSIIFENNGHTSVAAPSTGWYLTQEMTEVFQNGYTRSGGDVLALSLPVDFKVSKLFDDEFVSLFNISHYLRMSMAEAHNLLLSAEFFNWYGSPVSIIDYCGVVPVVNVYKVPYALAFLQYQGFGL